MTAKPSAVEFDVIVVGSGRGGMTTAIAPSRLGRKSISQITPAQFELRSQNAA